MKALLAVALLTACGRIGFEPLDETPDGGMTGTSTGTTTARCGAFAPSASCLISEQSLVPGATGQVGGPTCIGNDVAAKFTFTTSSPVYIEVAATFDSVLHVLAGSTCDAPQVRCIDNPGRSGEILAFDVQAGQPIVVAVDGGCGDATISWQM